MLGRATYIVSGRLGERRVRDELAAKHSIGHEVTTIAGLAARLAGGLLRPVSVAEVRSALQEPPVTDLTSLRDLAAMPGFASAAARTLVAAWHANIVLADHAGAGGRWAELAALERHVAATYGTGALLPNHLIGLARERAHLAAKLTGRITLDRISDVPPLYRGLLADVAEHVDVTWFGASQTAPTWLPPAITWSPASQETPTVCALSCADPDHEALEALRWVHAHLSAGRRPEELALAAVAVAAYDDAILTQAENAGISLHAAHGLPAMNTGAGQVAAALADMLVRGPSQQRVGRMVSAARAATVGPLAILPETWADELKPHAYLVTVPQWRRALGQLAAREPEQALIVERLVADVTPGLAAAGRVGERWLGGSAAALWHQALAEGPTTVLEQSLQGLRVSDGVDPATAVLWGPAATSMAWPRPLTRLLGLASRSWPRRGSDEDALLTQRLRPGTTLREKSVAQVDAETFAALMAGAREEVVLSWPRRGPDGRAQAPSPLIAELRDVKASSAPVAGTVHALSEADRRAFRPAELRSDPRIAKARSAYASTYSPNLTPHDGVVRPHHPAVVRALGRTHSATSLKSLLLDPHAFVAQYALGWHRPEPQDELLALDPAALGTLLHEVLELTASLLAVAAPGTLEVAAAVSQARRQVAAKWEAERPVPPAVLWSATLRAVEAWATWSLTFDDGQAAWQESYAEVRFGYTTSSDADDDRVSLPWRQNAAVVLPGTDLRVRGVIDRLELDRNGRRVRVVDFKSGKPLKETDGLAGGEELQRTLYTVAVRQLLGEGWAVEALLAHPRQGVTRSLADPDAAILALTESATLAVANLLQGNAIAGPGLRSPFAATRIAYPASGVGGYLRTKAEAIGRVRGPLDAALGREA